MKLINVFRKTPYDVPGDVGDFSSPEVVPLLGSTAQSIPGLELKPGAKHLPLIDGVLAEHAKVKRKESRRIECRSSFLRFGPGDKASKLYAVYKRKSVRVFTSRKDTTTTISKVDEQALDHNFKEYQVSELENDTETVHNKKDELSREQSFEHTIQKALSTLSKQKLEKFPSNKEQNCEVQAEIVAEKDAVEDWSEVHSLAEQVVTARKGTIRKPKRCSTPNSQTRPNIVELDQECSLGKSSTSSFNSFKTCSTSKTVPSIACGFVLNMAKYFESVSMTQEGSTL